MFDKASTVEEPRAKFADVTAAARERTLVTGGARNIVKHRAEPVIGSFVFFKIVQCFIHCLLIDKSVGLEIESGRRFGCGREGQRRAILPSDGGRWCVRLSGACKPDATTQ